MCCAVHWWWKSHGWFKKWTNSTCKGYSPVLESMRCLCGSFNKIAQSWLQISLVMSGSLNLHIFQTFSLSWRELTGSKTHPHPADEVFDMLPSMDELGHCCILASPNMCNCWHSMVNLENASEADSCCTDYTWIASIQWQSSSWSKPDSNGGGTAHCTYKNIYETRPLIQFWIPCQTDFPQLTAKATRSLLPFATHLC